MLLLACLFPVANVWYFVFLITAVTTEAHDATTRMFHKTAKLTLSPSISYLTRPAVICGPNEIFTDKRYLNVYMSHIENL